MSTVVIADLNRVEELAPSDMRQVAGGMSCKTQVDLGDGLGDLRDAFNNLGFYGAGNALDEQAREVLSQGCTV